MGFWREPPPPENPNFPNQPQFNQFKNLFKKYHWDSCHAAFGFEADIYDAHRNIFFPWIIKLENDFKIATNAFKENVDFDIRKFRDLIVEMIIWGGNQGRILKHFAFGLRVDDDLSRFKNYIKDILDNLENDNPLIPFENAKKWKGIKDTYASKFLRYCCPENYGALDRKIKKALGWQIGDDYKKFLDLITYCKWNLAQDEIVRPFYADREASIYWKASEIEMALFAWANQNH